MTNKCKRQHTSIAGSDHAPATDGTPVAPETTEPGSGVFIHVYESRDFIELVKVQQGVSLVLRKLQLNGVIGQGQTHFIRRLKEEAAGFGLEVEAVLRESQIPDVAA